jgi:hypothetical protein
MIAADFQGFEQWPLTFWPRNQNSIQWKRQTVLTISLFVNTNSDYRGHWRTWSDRLLMGRLLSKLERL